MKIFQYLKFIDFITIFNVVAGILAMLFSINGTLYTAVVFFFIAVVLDTLDGKISGIFERGTPFGKELDSLADIISFGIAPVVFLNSFLEQNIVTVVAYAFFVSCGVLRLARFNITSMPYFEGMPITLNGIIIPVLFLMHTPVVLYPYLLFLLGLFMISDFRIKKLLGVK